MLTRTTGTFLLLTAVISAGCSSAQEPPPSESQIRATAAEKLGSLLARNPQQEPHSARVTETSTWNGRVEWITKARASFENGDVTGHFTTQVFATEDSPGTTQEWVRTEDAEYVLAQGDAVPEQLRGTWQAYELKDVQFLPDLNGYARRVLAGPTVTIVEGHQEGGISTTRISERVPVEELKELEPDRYHALQRKEYEYIEAVDIQICVDASGRVVRLDQWLGGESHTVIRLSDFAGPFEQETPRDGSPAFDTPDGLGGSETDERPAA